MMYGLVTVVVALTLVAFVTLTVFVTFAVLVTFMVLVAFAELVEFMLVVEFIVAVEFIAVEFVACNGFACAVKADGATTEFVADAVAITDSNTTNDSATIPRYLSDFPIITIDFLAKLHLAHMRRWYRSGVLH